MKMMGPKAGRRCIVRGIGAAVLLMASVAAVSAGQFPFDQELLLDTAPMRPGKRMPMLTVAPDGKATIELWCKSVNARVELSDAAIKIEPEPLPEAMPEMQGAGQCSRERVQADEALLAALSQVTAWQSDNGALVLTGAARMKFRPATN